MNSLTEARVSEVRAFNRFYTKVAGALQAGMLDSPYTLVEVRVLFEVAQAGEPEARTLRDLLGIDAGYLSRVLARLEGAGLLVRRRSDSDARRLLVRLTSDGAAAFAELDRRQSERTAALLSHLSEAEQADLVSGMAGVRALLGDRPAPGPLLIRAPRSGDLGWVVSRHAALYAQEYGWGLAFEQTVARICADYTPGRDAGWIAEADGRPVGCVFCTGKDDTTAQLRMLLVEPSARGLGLGRRLVGEVVAHARASGYERITLWTRACLVGARRIYREAGFALESAREGEENGVPVTEEVWSLPLAAAGSATSSAVPRGASARAQGRL
ncbi:bifunctional helix-turn-helix transcriptional regulator/GNAT family N-acetyltransferase [Nonomuraea longicatena]|uniref:bifunctional helix-turn-helix transcriptional regulator/GNAT family N-acetyltransferase n=1 Tax=Nonomuraea longicatena TaxID=83682 RepID=UPI003CD0982B